MGDLGTRLQDARLRAGLSLREVSTRTKIREPLLNAIEREDFERLPAGLVGRGFLRAYAREVGLDPESIVRQFQDQFEAGPTPPEPTFLEAARDSRQVQGIDGTRVWRWGFLIIAGLAAVTAGGFSYVNYCAGIGGSLGSDLIATVDSPDVSAASLTQELEDGAEQHPPELAAVAVKASEANSFTLVVDPTGLVWVEATADGTRVLYQLVEPGERRSIHVREELLLRVGDAGAFQYSIDDVPGRSLGRSGQVRDVRITRDDYSSFQVR